MYFEREIKKLCEMAKKINISLSDEMLIKFDLYANMLIAANKSINITAITQPEQIMQKHFLDSILPVAKNLIKSDTKVIDIGTGGGFPGIPLKIVLPDIEITLIDSLNKRITFLNNVVSDLALQNTSPIHARAEQLGHEETHREKYDIAVSRAVCNMCTLCEYSLPFVKVGGTFIAYKGKNSEDEINCAKFAIEQLGCYIADDILIEIPYTDIIHRLVIIKKNENTSSKYPRKQAKIANSPIILQKNLSI